MAFFSRNKQSKQQQFKQKQIDTQQEAQIELLKSQIDSLFEIFGDVVEYLKGDKVNQRDLLRLNDAAVSNVKLFASKCVNKDKKMLMVAHDYFCDKKQSMDAADQRIVKSWIDYSNAALLGKKLKKLQISKTAVDTGHKNMQQGGLEKFVDTLVGAEHGTNDIVRNAQQNREQLRREHQHAAQRNQQRYHQQQNIAQCPGQDKMYNLTGGSRNIQLCTYVLV